MNETEWNVIVKKINNTYSQPLDHAHSSRVV